MRLQRFIKVPCNTCTSYGVRFLNTVIIQDKMVYTESVDKLYIYIYIYISGGPLSALTCCVNARLLSGDKKNIAVNLFSKLGWELGLYYASYDDFHPDILARMYT